MSFREYTNKTAEEVLRELRSSALGLSIEEIKKRQLEYGKNYAGARKNFWWDNLTKQVLSPFFLMVIFIGLVYILIGNLVDGGVIGIFLLLNLLISLFHEFRSDRAIKKLDEYLPTKVRVVRGGRLFQIDSKDLVPGDVVRLRSGDIVPADMHLIEERGLLVDESSFDGESRRVAKNSFSIVEDGVANFSNTVFSGTVIVGGLAEAVVVGTGERTYLGQMTSQIKKKSSTSLYEQEIFGFSKNIFKMAGVTVMALFSLKLIISGANNFLDTFIFYIALLVSLLPEALSLVTTFALSRGAIKMAEKQVVIKRLNAIEEMGNIEILCTDKTGTLTENKLTLQKIFSADPKICLEKAIFGSSFIKDGSFETPFDEALFNESSLKMRKKWSKIKQIETIPFDYNRLRADILVEESKGERMMIMRGAPEKIIQYCSKGVFSSSKTKPLKDHKFILKEFQREGKKGSRILAIAFKKVSAKKNDLKEEDEKGFTFCGFISFSDPLKKTAKETVRLAEKLGVEIKILTGDSKESATRIAIDVGLITDGKKVIAGEELENLSERKFRQACLLNAVFVRLSPELKIRIIEALKLKKRVGFLGEGANDCLAIERANVGIVVAESAGISRNASDIVLLRKDLTVLIEGIKEGRKIFANLNKYIKTALSTNFGNFYSVAIASFFSLHLPILPIQILLINLLSDVALISMATDKVDAIELKKPSDFDLKKSIKLIAVMTFVNFIAGVSIFWFFRESSSEIIQTVWFITSITTQVALIFVLRSRYVFFRVEAPGITLTVVSAVTIFLAFLLPFSVVGREFFHFHRPDVAILSFVILISLIYFLLSEMAKVFYYQNTKKEG